MCVGRKGAACGITVSATQDGLETLAIAGANSRYYTEQTAPSPVVPPHLVLQ